MAITSYNTAPYYDDFNTQDANGRSAADKNYLRILFQPGFAVQTRELNQMQSILQSQIDRFGSSFYRDGQPVIDGESTYQDEIIYIEVEPLSTITADDLINNLNLQVSLDVRPTGNEGDSYLKILKSEKISDSSIRIYCTPISLSDDSPNTSLTEYIPIDAPIFYHQDTRKLADGTTADDTDGIGTVTAAGYGFGGSVEEGVYFIKGCFVHTPKLVSYWIKSQKTEIPKGDLSLRIDENIITSNQDETLLDNSSGSYNFAGPGANRYQISLSLIFDEDGSSLLNIPNQSAGIFQRGTTRSFDIARLFTISAKGSILQENITKDEFEFEKKIAKRSYEEFGNYTLKPFKLSIRNFENDTAGNEGKYTESEIEDNKPFNVSTLIDARKKFLVELEGSTAYLNGFRYEFPQTTTLAVDRSRAVESPLTSAISFDVGNYVDIELKDSPHGRFSVLDGNPESALADGNANSPSVRSSSPSNVINSEFFAPNSPGFKPVLKSLVYRGDNDTDGTIKYRAYLYNDVSIDDVKNVFPGLKNKDSLVSLSGGSSDNTVKVQDRLSGSRLFKLPYDNVQRVSSVSYTILHSFSPVSAGSLVAGKNTLGPFDTSKAGGGSFIGTTSSDKFDYTIIEHNSPGDLRAHERIINPENYDISSSSTTTSLTFEDIADDADGSPFGFRRGRRYTVIAPITKSEISSFRTKTKIGSASPGTRANHGKLGHTNFSPDEFGEKATGTIIELDEQDVITSSIRISADESSGTNQNSFTILSDGYDNPDFYGKVKIKLTEPIDFDSPNSPHITFEYYEHSSTGDFFSVNSYGNYTADIDHSIEYTDIPKYKGQSLGDFLDFRRKIDFTRDTDANGNSPKTVHVLPSKEGSVKLTHYLSRKDRIVLEQSGNLAVITGRPAINPVMPEAPPRSMTLYTYFTPAYTGDVKDIEVVYFDNSRFTMKQVAGLKKRIENIEYLNALSVLENHTIRKAILNEDGTERFKIGMLVDTFKKDSFADALNPQYLAAMDKENGVLRPYCSQKSYRLFYQYPSATLAADKQDNVEVATDYYDSSEASSFNYNVTQRRIDFTGVKRPNSIFSKGFPLDEDEGHFIMMRVSRRLPEAQNTRAPEYSMRSQTSIFNNLGVLVGGGQTTTFLRGLNTQRRVIYTKYQDNPVAYRWEVQSYDAGTNTYSTLYYPTTTGTDGYNASNPVNVTGWRTVEDSTAITSNGVRANFRDTMRDISGVTDTSVENADTKIKRSATAKNANRKVRSGTNNVEQLSTWLGEKKATTSQPLNAVEGVGVEPLFEQTNCTRTLSIQPFENAVYQGKVKLSPSSDEWVSTNRRPAVVSVNDSANQVIQFLQNETALLDGLTGTEWNSWQTTWSSTEFEESITRERGVRLVGGREVRNFSRRWPITATRTIVDRTVEESIRTGVTNELSFSSIEESNGDRVVNINVVPFIRSRDIGFYASGLKPNTQVYVFFDGVDVTRYCAPTAGFVEYGQHEDVTVYDDRNQALPDSRTNGAFTSTELNHYAIPMVTTSETGEFFGTFRIPNSDTLQFKTGVKQFKITSSPLNNDDEADTFAEATYSARGFIQDVVEEITSTRVPEIVTTQRQESRTVVTDRSRVERWTYDPVAQTFLIDEEEYPDGLFVSDVDLFFAEKPEYIADAQVYIVTVENGIPTTTVVPGSHVTLPYQRVNVPAGGRNETNGGNILSTPTNFKFDNPVYLEPRKEYALVAFSKSPDYRIWVAELGGSNLTNQNLPLTTNSSIGVLLKSQNGRTWTPDQMKDLMFRLNKAVFATEGSFAFHTQASAENGGNTQGLALSSGSDRFSAFNIFDETLLLPKCTINYNVDFLKTDGSALSKVTFGIPKNCKSRTTYELSKEINTGSSNDNVNNIVVTANVTAPDRGDGFADIGPVIDLERMSLLGIRNRLESATTTNNDTQGYISKRVELTNPAQDVRLFIATNRQFAEANLNAYVKTRLIESNDTPWDELDWKRMKIESINGGTVAGTGTANNSPVLAINTDSDTFTEHEFKFSNTSPAEFKEYAIKLSFTGDDAAKIVKVKDLRAIATI